VHKRPVVLKQWNPAKSDPPRFERRLYNADGDVGLIRSRGQC
jgi:hypothetical protein